MAKFLLRRDQSQKFYWLLWSDKNSKVIARSSESYETRQGATHSIEWTRGNVKDAKIDDATAE